MITISRKLSADADCAHHQRRKALKATYCTALGWATMLLALSQATAFSSSGLQSEFAASSCRRKKSATPGYTCFQNSAGFHSRRSLTMTYGNRVQKASWSNMGPRTHLSLPDPQRIGATQLGYRDGDAVESSERQSEHDNATETMQPRARWWNSVFQRPTQPEAHNQEQQVVDEYLEFLDRRYKRMHNEEVEPEQPKEKKFSVLGWLNGDREGQNVVTMQQQEDALYVLGVAELASERLLQKHQLALQQKKQSSSNEEVIIDATVSQVGPSPVGVAATSAAPALPVVSIAPPTSPLKRDMMVAGFVASARTVLKRIKAHRRTLIATEDRQAKRLVAMLTRTLIAAPTRLLLTLKKAWRLGGGTRTLAFTVSAFVAAFFVVRPIAEAVIREGMLEA